MAARSRCSTIWPLVVTLMLGGLSSGADAAPLNPADEIDKDAKCPPTRPDLIRERVDQILKSEVVKAIEKQITDANPEKKELKPVKVRVFLVDKEELAQELATDQRKDLDAGKLFERFDAFTYVPNTDKTGTVKIKIFCKNSVQKDLGENGEKHGFDRVFVHELVHAKIIAMQDVGEKAPFGEGEVKDDPPPADRKGEHNGKFSKEIDELMKVLPK